MVAEPGVAPLVIVGVDVVWQVDFSLVVAACAFGGGWERFDDKHRADAKNVEVGDVGRDGDVGYVYDVTVEVAPLVVVAEPCHVSLLTVVSSVADDDKFVTTDAVRPVEVVDH